MIDKDICMDIHRKLEIVFAVNKLLGALLVFGHLPLSHAHSPVALTHICTYAPLLSLLTQDTIHDFPVFCTFPLCGFQNCGLEISLICKNVGNLN